jgi:uncharacterized membrane protein
MSWFRRYNLGLYLRNSIWILPTLSIVAALLSVAFLNRLERSLGWTIQISPETARNVVVTVAASMFTLVVIASSAVLVAVQLASSQLTPRIIAFVYRSRMRKAGLALFVFTFTFSVAALVRIQDSVPLLTTYLASYGFLLNLAFFIYFMDGMGKTLRPSTALRTIALAGREVIRSVYPWSLNEKYLVQPERIEVFEDDLRRTVLNEADGVLLAFDDKGLLRLAQRSACVIELVPQVGDYVAAGDPLFKTYHGGENLSETTLQNSVAMGQERTLEQDPMYAFRIIVDIASKALSPAINDPTTAVLAVDQIHHLLRDVGSRYLAEGAEADESGHVRLIYRTPNWEDFVHLAVTEIRQYGRDSIQVTRRLRAMLENLISTLPERRASLLRRELALVEASSKRAFPDRDDQLLAEVSDLQGLGGSHTDTGNREPFPAPLGGSMSSTGASAA